MKSLLKVWRYILIYGVRRTLFKIAGRSGRTVPLLMSRNEQQDVGLIGCGQFGVTSLGYFLSRQFGRRIKTVYDVDNMAALKGGRILGAKSVVKSAEEIIADPEISFIYIASNHASHTEYAVAGLNAGKTVYVEKPVAVTIEQLMRLSSAVKRNSSSIYVGYNRPFSAAVRALREEVGRNSAGGVSLNCFVSGHIIEQEHWYRDPKEGTRICGNAGHWIDLFCHVLTWREIEMPDRYRIQLLQADPDEPDDNFMLSIATEQNDVFGLMLTARSEPFEGINETVNFQQDEVICKIDDFRRMTLWKGTKLYRKRFWPKDVGHKLAALQPFGGATARNWSEIETSALLVLHITNMVRSGITESEFCRSEGLALLGEGMEY